MAVRQEEVARLWGDLNDKRLQPARNSARGRATAQSGERFPCLGLARLSLTRHNHRSGKFVSYLRVSTKRQGESGLGLEAQRAAVETWLNGGDWTLCEEHVEVESGKRDDNRPALAKAFDACRAFNAKLVIAKLDRLSRDAHFLLGLEKAGVEFVAVDMPHANRLTVGIMALVAEQEREAISQRTKAALAAAKARGTRLGKPKGTKVPNAEIGCARSVETNMANAESFARRMRPVLTELNELSARSAAQELERRGYATARGGKWSATLVIRTRARLGIAP